MSDNNGDETFVENVNLDMDDMELGSQISGLVLSHKSNTTQLDALKAMNEQTAKLLLDKISTDERDKKEINDKFKVLQDLLIVSINSRVTESPTKEKNVDDNIDDWAAAKSGYGLLPSSRDSDRSPIKESKHDKRRDSDLRRDLMQNYPADSRSTVSNNTGPVISLQNDFVTKKFDHVNRFTFASFVDLCTKLTSFMQGRSRTERIGRNTLISDEYFNVILRNNIAVRLNTIREIYELNMERNEDDDKIMYELPEFFLNEKTKIDVAFLSRLHWGEALAWLELYFKATSKTAFVDFYKEAALHIKTNLVRTRYIKVNSTPHICNDVRNAHQYFEQCMSINPQKHTSSTEETHVSVGVFPGMRDMKVPKSDGMITILLSYLPPNIAEQLKSQIFNIKTPRSVDTMVKVMAIIDKAIKRVVKAYHAAEGMWLAIIEDIDYPWNVPNHKLENNTVSWRKFVKNKSAKVNNLEEDNDGSPISIDPTYSALSDITNEHNSYLLAVESNMRNQNTEAKSVTEDSFADDNRSVELVNSLLNRPEIREAGYCTRAMFANKKGKAPCDNPNCKYVHDEAGYKLLIKELSTMYNK
jgi:flagellar biosynthesis regulator FlaF